MPDPTWPDAYTSGPAPDPGSPDPADLPDPPERIEWADTQRRRRGHRFLPPLDTLRRIPKLYATDGIGALDDKHLWLHYFAASGDWYVAELDQESWIAFGWADLGSGEWGQFSLTELEQVRVHSGLVIVERDLHWVPKPWRLAMAVRPR